MGIIWVRLYIVNIPERRQWWSGKVYGHSLHQKPEHRIAKVKTNTGLIDLAQIERNPWSETF